MSDKVPIDAARLRAAVSDERYWRAGHPERDAWRAWVTNGFQAMYGSDARPSGGVVHVRAYVRNGQPVAAHTRSATAASGERIGKDRPDASPRGGQVEIPNSVDAGLRGLALRRRSLLDDDFIMLAMARRPEGGGVGDRKGVVPEGGGGGGSGFRPPAAGRAPQAPAAPPISPRSQELIDIIAPRGSPIGSQQGNARANIRTLPGGQPAAEAMFRRLTEGRIRAERPPSTYNGRMVELDDGSIIGLRPGTSSGSPAVDINIPGFTAVTRLHF